MQVDQQVKEIGSENEASIEIVDRERGYSHDEAGHQSTDDLHNHMNRWMTQR